MAVQTKQNRYQCARILLNQKADQKYFFAKQKKIKHAFVAIYEIGFSETLHIDLILIFSLAKIPSPFSTMVEENFEI